MYIKLTDTAKEQILKENIEKKDVRIYMVSMGGWGPPSFGLSLEEAKDADKVMEIEGMIFAVEKFLVENFRGFKVDYGKNMLEEGYIVTSKKSDRGKLIINN